MRGTRARWSAAAVLALFPTVLGWTGSALIASTGLFYWDIDVTDGIGILPLAQGLGVGHLGSAGIAVTRTLWEAEIVVLGFALPMIMVVGAGLLPRRWRGRCTVIAAAALGVLALVNLAATPVGLWSDLLQCPPSDMTGLPDGYSCYRNGTGVGVPPFLYGLAYGLAALVLAPLLPRRGRHGTREALA